MFRIYIKSILAALALLLLPTIGVAQGAIIPDDIAKVSILPGWRAADGRHMAGIRIELAKGWKTYWRSPGEAGIPPQFNWSGSKNLGSVKIIWPTPNVYHINGMRSVGYDGTIVLPIEIAPRRKGNLPIALRAKMEIGVCEDICIPISVKLSGNLSAPGMLDADINQSIQNQPVDGRKAGVRSVTCQVDPISDGLRLTTQIDMPRLGQAEYVVVELPDKSIWVSQPTAKRQGGKLVTVAEMVPANGQPFLLDRSQVRITVLGDHGAVDILGCSAS
ncbi:MAG: hypothetical protein KUG69_08710 [Marinosulfonomonas sp.]|nr:hypothetical protein [Marinosulfonomonas sp.]